MNTISMHKWNIVNSCTVIKIPKYSTGLNTRPKTKMPNDAIERSASVFNMVNELITLSSDALEEKEKNYP